MSLPAPLETPSSYDVAIVGFGPSGAVAAGLLGMQGLRVFVCDKADDIYSLPRAFAIDHEIMRVFQQLGVAEQVLEHTEPFTPSEFFGVDGQLIKRFTTVEPPYPLSYVPSLVFSQPPVERILRAQVNALPSVDVELGCELLELHQNVECATLKLQSACGTSRQVTARYVIGCDGASSKVRSAVGVALQDLGFDEPWLVVDVLVNERGLAKLPKTSVQFCEPTRPCTYLIGPKNHRRWEIALHENEDLKKVATPEGTWALLSRWITPDDASLWRQATYRFHALVADRWQTGRVFVAGDAAHQQPPFLGQGMCQGIRDVTNLSWKLGAVLRGEAPEELLETYGAERKMHVTELTARIKAIGQIVGQRDVAKARGRDAHLLAECGGVVKSVPRQNVQPALATGLLGLQASQARGTIFPQPWIKRAGARLRMDELAGTGWRVVTDSGMEKGVLDNADCLGNLNMTVVDLAAADFQEADGVLANWFLQYACSAAIVRPDHYVYAVANSAEALLAQLDALAQSYLQRQEVI